MRFRGLLNNLIIIATLAAGTTASADPNLATFQMDPTKLEAKGSAELCLTCLWKEALTTDKKIRADYPFIKFETGAKIPVNPDPSFHSPEDSRLPEKVREASKSVFRVFSVVDAEELDTAAFERKITSFSIPNPQTKSIAIDMLRQCRAEKEKTCPFPTLTAHGTAFLAGDGEGLRLWTNGHVLRGAFAPMDPDFSEYEGLRKKGKLFAPFFIFDRAGRLVATPYDRSLKVVRSPTSSEMKVNRPAQDWVELTLPKSLGTPLKIAAKPATDGTQILYRPGFPACTGCAQNPGETATASRYPYQDADGYHMFVSKGAYIPMTPANVGSVVPAKDAIDPKTLFLSNADSRQGFSGSPDLNAQGEVVSVHFAFQQRRHPSDKRVQTTVSLSVRPPDWK